MANTLDLSTVPTIWDRLTEAGLAARYYFSDAPFLALFGDKYLNISARSPNSTLRPPPILSLPTRVRQE